MNLNMRHVSLKTRSLCQILEKTVCMLQRSHCCPILLKVGPIVGLDDISKQFENWSVGSKTRSPRQILEISCVSLVLLKVGLNIFLDDISYEFGNGLCRSLGQFIEIHMLVIEGFLFHFLLVNTLSHNPESSECSVSYCDHSLSAVMHPVCGIGALPPFLNECPLF